MIVQWTVVDAGMNIRNITTSLAKPQTFSPIQHGVNTLHEIPSRDGLMIAVKTTLISNMVATVRVNLPFASSVERNLANMDRNGP